MWFVYRLVIVYLCVFLAFPMQAWAQQPRPSQPAPQGGGNNPGGANQGNNNGGNGGAPAIQTRPQTERERLRVKLHLASWKLAKMILNTDILEALPRFQPTAWYTTLRPYENRACGNPFNDMPDSVEELDRLILIPAQDALSTFIEQRAAQIEDLHRNEVPNLTLRDLKIDLLRSDVNNNSASCLPVLGRPEHNLGDAAVGFTRNIEDIRAEEERMNDNSINFVQPLFVRLGRVGPEVKLTMVEVSRWLGWVAALRKWRNYVAQAYEKKLGRAAPPIPELKLNLQSGRRVSQNQTDALQRQIRQNQTTSRPEQLAQRLMSATKFNEKSARWVPCHQKERLCGSEATGIRQNELNQKYCFCDGKVDPSARIRADQFLSIQKAQNEENDDVSHAEELEVLRKLAIQSGAFELAHIAGLNPFGERARNKEELLRKWLPQSFRNADDLEDYREVFVEMASVRERRWFIAQLANAVTEMEKRYRNGTLVAPIPQSNEFFDQAQTRAELWVADLYNMDPDNIPRFDEDDAPIEQPLERIPGTGVPVRPGSGGGTGVPPRPGSGGQPTSPTLPPVPRVEQFENNFDNSQQGRGLSQAMQAIGGGGSPLGAYTVAASLLAGRSAAQGAPPNGNPPPVVAPPMPPAGGEFENNFQNNAPLNPEVSRALRMIGSGIGGAGPLSTAAGFLAGEQPVVPPPPVAPVGLSPDLVRASSTVLSGTNFLSALTNLAAQAQQNPTPTRPSPRISNAVINITRLVTLPTMPGGPLSFLANGAPLFANGGASNQQPPPIVRVPQYRFRYQLSSFWQRQIFHLMHMFPYEERIREELRGELQGVGKEFDQRLASKLRFWSVTIADELAELSDDEWEDHRDIIYHMLRQVVEITLVESLEAYVQALFLSNGRSIRTLTDKWERRHRLYYQRTLQSTDPDSPIAEDINRMARELLDEILRYQPLQDGFDPDAAGREALENYVAQVHGRSQEAARTNNAMEYMYNHLVDQEYIPNVLPGGWWNQYNYHYRAAQQRNVSEAPSAFQVEGSNGFGRGWYPMFSLQPNRTDDYQHVRVGLSSLVTRKRAKISNRLAKAFLGLACRDNAVLARQVLAARGIRNYEGDDLAAKAAEEAMKLDDDLIDSRIHDPFRRAANEEARQRFRRLANVNVLTDLVIRKFSETLQAKVENDRGLHSRQSQQRYRALEDWLDQDRTPESYRTLRQRFAERVYTNQLEALLDAHHRESNASHKTALANQLKAMLEMVLEREIIAIDADRAIRTRAEAIRTEANRGVEDEGRHMTVDQARRRAIAERVFPDLVRQYALFESRQNYTQLQQQMNDFWTNRPGDIFNTQGNTWRAYCLNQKDRCLQWLSRGRALIEDARIEFMFKKRLEFRLDNFVRSFGQGGVRYTGQALTGSHQQLLNGADGYRINLMKAWYGAELDAFDTNAEKNDADAIRGALEQLFRTLSRIAHEDGNAEALSQIPQLVRTQHDRFHLYERWRERTTRRLNYVRDMVSAQGNGRSRRLVFRDLGRSAPVMRAIFNIDFRIFYRGNYRFSRTQFKKYLVDELVELMFPSFVVFRRELSHRLEQAFVPQQNAVEVISGATRRISDLKDALWMIDQHEINNTEHQRETIQTELDYLEDVIVQTRRRLSAEMELDRMIRNFLSGVSAASAVLRSSGGSLTEMWNNYFDDNFKYTLHDVQPTREHPQGQPMAMTLADAVNDLNEVAEETRGRISTDHHVMKLYLEDLSDYAQLGIAGSRRLQFWKNYETVFSSEIRRLKIVENSLRAIDGEEYLEQNAQQLGQALRLIGQGNQGLNVLPPLAPPSTPRSQLAVGEAVRLIGAPTSGFGALNTLLATQTLSNATRENNAHRSRVIRRRIQNQLKQRIEDRLFRIWNYTAPERRASGVSRLMMAPPGFGGGPFNTLTQLGTVDLHFRAWVDRAVAAYQLDANRPLAFSVIRRFADPRNFFRKVKTEADRLLEELNREVQESKDYDEEHPEADRNRQRCSDRTLDRYWHLVQNSSDVFHHPNSPFGPVFEDDGTLHWFEVSPSFDLPTAAQTVLEDSRGSITPTDVTRALFAMIRLPGLTRDRLTTIVGEQALSAIKVTLPTRFDGANNSQVRRNWLYALDGNQQQYIFQRIQAYVGQRLRNPEQFNEVRDLLLASGQTALPAQTNSNAQLGYSDWFRELRRYIHLWDLNEPVFQRNLNALSRTAQLQREIERRTGSRTQRRPLFEVLAARIFKLVVNHTKYRLKDRRFFMPQANNRVTRQESTTEFFGYLRTGQHRRVHRLMEDIAAIYRGEIRRAVQQAAREGSTENSDQEASDEPTRAEAPVRALPQRFDPFQPVWNPHRVGRLSEEDRVLAFFIENFVRDPSEPRGYALYPSEVAWMRHHRVSYLTGRMSYTTRSHRFEPIWPTTGNRATQARAFDEWLKILVRDEAAQQKFRLLKEQNRRGLRRRVWENFDSLQAFYESSLRDQIDGLFHVADANAQARRTAETYPFFLVLLNWNINHYGVGLHANVPVIEEEPVSDPVVAGLMRHIVDEFRIDMKRFSGWEDLMRRHGSARDWYAMARSKRNFLVGVSTRRFLSTQMPVHRVANPSAGWTGGEYAYRPFHVNDEERASFCAVNSGENAFYQWFAQTENLENNALYRVHSQSIPGSIRRTVQAAGDWIFDTETAGYPRQSLYQRIVAVGNDMLGEADLVGRRQDLTTEEMGITGNPVVHSRLRRATQATGGINSYRFGQQRISDGAIARIRENASSGGVFPAPTAQELRSVAQVRERYVDFRRMVSELNSGYAHETHGGEVTINGARTLLRGLLRNYLVQIGIPENTARQLSEQVRRLNIQGGDGGLQTTTPAVVRQMIARAIAIAGRLTYNNLFRGKNEEERTRLREIIRLIDVDYRIQGQVIEVRRGLAVVVHNIKDHLDDLASRSFKNIRSDEDFEEAEELLRESKVVFFDNLQEFLYWQSGWVQDPQNSGTRRRLMELVAREKNKESIKRDIGQYVSWFVAVSILIMIVGGGHPTLSTIGGHLTKKLWVGIPLMVLGFVIAVYFGYEALDSIYEEYWGQPDERRFLRTIAESQFFGFRSLMSDQRAASAHDAALRASVYGNTSLPYFRWAWRIWLLSLSFHMLVPMMKRAVGGVAGYLTRKIMGPENYIRWRMIRHARALGVSRSTMLSNMSTADIQREIQHMALRRMARQLQPGWFRRSMGWVWDRVGLSQNRALMQEFRALAREMGVTEANLRQAGNDIEAIIVQMQHAAGQTRFAQLLPEAFVQRLNAGQVQFAELREAVLSLARPRGSGGIGAPLRTCQRWVSEAEGNVERLVSTLERELGRAPLRRALSGRGLLERMAEAQVSAWRLNGGVSPSLSFAMESAEQNLLMRQANRAFTEANLEGLTIDQTGNHLFVDPRVAQTLRAHVQREWEVLCQELRLNPMSGRPLPPIRGGITDNAVRYETWGAWWRENRGWFNPLRYMRPYTYRERLPRLAQEIINAQRAASSERMELLLRMRASLDNGRPFVDGNDLIVLLADSPPAGMLHKPFFLQLLGLPYTNRTILLVNSLRSTANRAQWALRYLALYRANFFRGAATGLGDVEHGARTISDIAGRNVSADELLYAIFHENHEFHQLVRYGRYSSTPELGISGEGGVGIATRMQGRDWSRLVEACNEFQTFWNIGRFPVSRALFRRYVITRSSRSGTRRLLVELLRSERGTVQLPNEWEVWERQLQRRQDARTRGEDGQVGQPRLPSEELRPWEEIYPTLDSAAQTPTRMNYRSPLLDPPIPERLETAEEILIYFSNTGRTRLPQRTAMELEPSLIRSTGMRSRSAAHRQVLQLRGRIARRIANNHGLNEVEQDVVGQILHSGLSGEDLHAVLMRMIRAQAECATEGVATQRYYELMRMVSAYVRAMEVCNGDVLAYNYQMMGRFYFHMLQTFRGAEAREADHLNMRILDEVYDALFVSNALMDPASARAVENFRAVYLVVGNWRNGQIAREALSREILEARVREIRNILDMLHRNGPRPAGNRLRAEFDARWFYNRARGRLEKARRAYGEEAERRTLSDILCETNVGTRQGPMEGGDLYYFFRDVNPADNELDQIFSQLIRARLSSDQLEMRFNRFETARALNETQRQAYEKAIGYTRAVETLGLGGGRQFHQARWLGEFYTHLLRMRHVNSRMEFNIRDAEVFFRLLTEPRTHQFFQFSEFRELLAGISESATPRQIAARAQSLRGALRRIRTLIGDNNTGLVRDNFLARLTLAEQRVELAERMLCLSVRGENAPGGFQTLLTSEIIGVEQATQLNQTQRAVLGDLFAGDGLNALTPLRRIGHLKQRLIRALFRTRGTRPTEGGAVQNFGLEPVVVELTVGGQTVRLDTTAKLREAFDLVVKVEEFLNARYALEFAQANGILTREEAGQFLGRFAREIAQGGPRRYPLNQQEAQHVLESFARGLAPEMTEAEVSRALFDREAFETLLRIVSDSNSEFMRAASPIAGEVRAAAEIFYQTRFQTNTSFEMGVLQAGDNSVIANVGLGSASSSSRGSTFGLSFRLLNRTDVMENEALARFFFRQPAEGNDTGLFFRAFRTLTNKGAETREVNEVMEALNRAHASHEAPYSREWNRLTQSGARDAQFRELEARRAMDPSPREQFFRDLQARAQWTRDAEQRRRLELAIQRIRERQEMIQDADTAAGTQPTGRSPLETGAPEGYEQTPGGLLLPKPQRIIVPGEGGTGGTPPTAPSGG